MAQGFESLEEKLSALPEREVFWVRSRVERVVKMLDERDQFPDMLFDGRPYDEQTAHLRLLQFHQDSIKQGLSDIGRQALLDVAIEFGLAAELPDDVIQANWLKASQEEQQTTVIRL